MSNKENPPSLKPEENEQLGKLPIKEYSEAMEQGQGSSFIAKAQKGLLDFTENGFVETVWGEKAGKRLTSAQKLAKTREFIKGKTGKDAELIKQRLDVDLAAKKPEEAEAAVKKLQATLGMSEKDQDGILGKKTFDKLLVALALETPKQPLTREKQLQIANEVQHYMGEINLYFTRAQNNPLKDNYDFIQYKTAMAAIEEKLGALRGYEKRLTQTHEIPRNFHVVTTRFGRVDFLRQRFDVAAAFGGREKETRYAQMKNEWQQKLANFRENYRDLVGRWAKKIADESLPTVAGAEALERLAPDTEALGLIRLVEKTNPVFKQDVAAKVSAIQVAKNPAYKGAYEASATNSTGLDTPK